MALTVGGLLRDFPRGSGLADRDSHAVTLPTMRALILGSAAGGGFPQWNCACPNCRSLRAGTFHGKARTQTEVAISADGQSWFLLGASPDLRAQIEATAELKPGLSALGVGSWESPLPLEFRGAGDASLHLKNGSAQHGVQNLRPKTQDLIRQSPIAGAVLANADIDHVLGLLLLRELQPLRVHATHSVRRILREDNSMFRMLERIADQVVWTDFAPGSEFPLCDARGMESGLTCRAISLATHFPAYVAAERQANLRPDESSLGLIVESSVVSGGKRIAFLAAVPAIDDALLAEIEVCDVLLFDGTFWSDDELIRVQGSGQTAREMGHVPVEDTLQRLERVKRPRKIFVHINNTNPMLDESGAEYRAVRAAGWEIAWDGMEI